jgi:hypothetical protein
MSNTVIQRPSKTSNIMLVLQEHHHDVTRYFSGGIPFCRRADRWPRRAAMDRD